jgi:GNAT superfamily N-acetyltransferase
MSGREVRVERLSGAALEAKLPDLAALRISVFREFPYLYDGTEDYERRYLRTYADTPGAVIVGAFAGDALVGAATGLPMAGEPPHVREPLERVGWPAERVFYLGESVLLPAWRGRGLGVRFFAEREAHARALGGFALAAFCAVVRPVDHPRRPRAYVPLDAFWQRRGYAKLDGVTCSFTWQDLDEAAQSPKPMQFWAKRLDGAPMDGPGPGA